MSHKDLLSDLQQDIQISAVYSSLADFFRIADNFLLFLEEHSPTRIISPTQRNYVFFQYSETHGYKITRPLNTDLFYEEARQFRPAVERFMMFLEELRQHQERIPDTAGNREYLASRELNRVIYTIQQSIGSIADSFVNSNQARKRVGQLFEALIKLVLQQVGLECEPRRIRIPIPDFPGYVMPYELDVVFSRNKVIITSETEFIYSGEIVGSIKLTSKDRIDKVFLDKYLLTQLLRRDIPVVAIFLHDVQRARRGNTDFGVNSTFKSNHFLGYTVALNRLDGVYYVDPRPEMRLNERLREQVFDLQQFLTQDLWSLSRTE